jgi:hypothetical protein
MPGIIFKLVCFCAYHVTVNYNITPREVLHLLGILCWVGLLLWLINLRELRRGRRESNLAGLRANH